MEADHLLCSTIVQLGQLPTLSLPDSPLSWIQMAEDTLRQKKQLPNDFSGEWCAWWAALQPTFRVTKAVQDANDLHHSPISSTIDWSSLMFGGAQGIIQVVYRLELCEDKYSNSTGIIEREWIQ
jgi:hypothetical protein